MLTGERPIAEAAAADMTMSFRFSPDRSRLTVRIPMRYKRRGGRKLIIGPADGENLRHKPKAQTALLKAIARAYRWQSMLEEGEFASLTELAKSEGVSKGYVARLFRLTLLSPDIVLDVLDGRQGALTLEVALAMPLIWSEQQAKILESA